MNKFYALIFTLFLFLSSNVYSQGFNSVYSRDGLAVFAVGDNGIYFRSSNAGNTWASYTNGSENMKSVFIVLNQVWIAGQAGKIFKTETSISPLTSLTIGTSQDLNCIYFPNRINGFVCGNNGVVFKTSDSGATWTSSNTGIDPVNLNSISFKDNNNGVAVGDGGKIYITTDGGATWASQTSPTTKRLLKAKYFHNGIGITGEDGVLIIKNGTGSFDLINMRTDSDIRGITGNSVDSIRVCGGGGFIRNNLNGVSNFYNFEMNPMMANLVDICYADAMNGWAVSSLNKAIIRTTNGGQTWSLPSGVSVSYVWQNKLSPGASGLGNNLCRHPYRKNTMFVMYGQNVYRSQDRGETWQSIATVNVSSSTPHSFYVSPNDTNIWVAATKGTPNKVIRTTNYGQTWSIIIERNFSTYGQPLEMDQNNPSVFYFAPNNTASDGLFKSTDNGATFNLVSTYNQSGINSPCDILVMWDSSNVIFLGDDGADIWKSTNGGMNWFLVKPGTSSEVPSMCSSVFDRKQIYATNWSSSQVFRSQNFGTNWSVVSNNSGSGWGSDVCREDPTLVLTGSYGASTYLSTNNGAGFTTISTGLSGAGAGIIVPERGYLLDQRTNGMFKMKITYDVITEIGSSNFTNTIPAQYELFQNYPNPFNPTTSIKFNVAKEGIVKLKVYDALGKEVKVLLNDIKNPGSYEVSFDGSLLSSGIYFYTLEAGDFVQTKKMMMLK